MTFSVETGRGSNVPKSTCPVQGGSCSEPPPALSCTLIPGPAEQSSPRARFPEMKRKKLMTSPRSFLQPCWHSCSLSADPRVGPVTSLCPTIPGPVSGTPVLPSLSLCNPACSVPPLPACPQLDTQSPSTKTLSPTFLCLSVSECLLWDTACPMVSRQLWPVLPSSVLCPHLLPFPAPLPGVSLLVQPLLPPRAGLAPSPCTWLWLWLLGPEAHSLEAEGSPLLPGLGEGGPRA